MVVAVADYDWTPCGSHFYQSDSSSRWFAENPIYLCLCRSHIWQDLGTLWAQTITTHIYSSLSIKPDRLHKAAIPLKRSLSVVTGEWVSKTSVKDCVPKAWLSEWHCKTALWMHDFHFPELVSQLKRCSLYGDLFINLLKCVVFLQVVLMDGSDCSLSSAQYSPTSPSSMLLSCLVFLTNLGSSVLHSHWSRAS